MTSELDGRRSVPEWVGKTPDSQIPRPVKARIWLRCGGRCHISGQRIGQGDAFDFDHIVALRDGGEHREGNIALALRVKHREKTAEEAGERAKVDRIFAKHHGLWPASKAKIRSRGFAATRTRP